ncbi:GntR family transcriptional regulator [Bordetella avium]|uniref:GntR-family transcriptional regulator n=1 Tax=Bordetella avium (strain 197N) TaxID=360910 RepID=Q2KXH4_BORA1|nr:GntR family transcriptional regulator [Bordetella avium]AZY48206.1 GntR family transcriptional regulator [Bordetella avium]AZY51586.1 GntR family transcriptional regulator [Bordetella avium]RIQ13550.1 GntR family transcriptional regulator [Bordetella avium]RIQ16496.1 GntR family transcriptional regulator [Bordetella avium]RIQ31254.1 GntR family transcriptional regulator [Bordetella avium]
MAAQIDKVISELRDMILSGEIAPGERIVELQFAARLGVSRTPLRIAMTELETEGLLERLPSRGFRVRAFTVEEIGDAVDVRGVLEGMAVRLLAERGVSDEVLASLKETVEAGRQLLAPAARNPETLVDARAWGRINQRFHDILCQAAGNRALLSALEHNNKTPLAGPAALTLPSTPSLLETPYVLRAQADHEDLLRAITRREAARAESLMREHAYRSRENKRVMLDSIKTERHSMALSAAPLAS